MTQIRAYLSKPCSSEDVNAMVMLIKKFIVKYYNQEVGFRDLITKNDKYAFCLLNSYIHYDNITNVRDRCLKSIRNAESYYDNDYKFAVYFDTLTINSDIKKLVKALSEQLKSKPNTR